MSGLTSSWGRGCCSSKADVVDIADAPRDVNDWQSDSFEVAIYDRIEDEEAEECDENCNTSGYQIV